MILLNNIVEFIFLKLNHIILRERNKNYNKTYLFISLSGLGDFIISHILLENTNLFVEKKTYFLFDKKYETFLSDYAGSINLFPVDREKYKFNILYRYRIIFLIRKLRLEKIYNLNKGRRIIDDQLTILSGSKEKIALSYCGKNFKKYFKYQIDKYYTDILNAANENEINKINTLLNIKDAEKNNRINKLYFSRNDCASSICSSMNYVVICPFSSSKFREWPIENYINIISWIIKNFSYDIILIGTTNAKINLIPNNRVVNLINLTTLEQAANILENAKLFIGNDSGLAHVSKALNKKRIILMGGGSYSHYFPYGNNKDEKLLFYQMDCFGCEWDCIHEKPFCLTNIDIAQLKDAVNLLIER